MKTAFPVGLIPMFAQSWSFIYFFTPVIHIHKSLFTVHWITDRIHPPVRASTLPPALHQHCPHRMRFRQRHIWEARWCLWNILHLSHGLLGEDVYKPEPKSSPASSRLTELWMQHFPTQEGCWFPRVPLGYGTCGFLSFYCYNIAILLLKAIFFGRGKPYTLFSKQFNVGFTGFTLLHTSLLLRLGLDKNKKRALFFSANPGAGTFSWLSWLSPQLHWCHCPELCCMNDVVIPCLKSGRSCLDAPI